MPGIDNFFGLGLRELRDWLTVLRTREMQGNAGREREMQGNGWQGNEDLRRGDG
jgi:hypothetical protein